MKYTIIPTLFISCLIVSFTCFALESTAIEKQANTSIKELYHTLNALPNISMAQRIDWISGQFKGTDYILGSLGEGADARYDQFPRYRVDGFDCDTFVNTVLSLALANSPAIFKQCLRYTRYNKGIISYLNRNHFTSIDWNKNNQQRGVLKDITATITDKQQHSIALYANAQINKPGWYAYKTLDTIRLQKANINEQRKRLNELKMKGRQFHITHSKVPYLPLNVLFANDGEPNLYIFSQIPNAAIVEIVRPDWDLRKQIGTSLNISHLGFVIKIADKLYFRQASSQYGKVVDVPLIDYLDKARQSPTIKGINVQIVLPQTPTNGECRAFKN